MRGKVRDITFYPPSYTQDDLGRRVRAEVAGLTVRGAASSPRLSKSVTPFGQRVDLVVHVAADIGAPLNEGMVEVSGLGDYTIVGLSGGRRIWRVDLARLVRKDLTSGRL